MPGVLKVWEKVPLDRTPEFQTSGPTFVSLVDVWGSGALKFHVIVSPGDTAGKGTARDTRQVRRAPAPAGAGCHAARSFGCPREGTGRDAPADTPSRRP